eukprot:scaffold112829_cov39-Phaeocystis_antarctica.AAC.1
MLAHPSWVTCTPFGLPVEPEVYMTYARWCGRTRAAAAAPKPTSTPAAAAASCSGTRRASSSSSTAPPNHPA